MKNVKGLREAMAVVESACEKGEITIIGEGAMPSAPDMLVKCAEFLVNKMGADVDLIAVVNDALVRYNNGEGKPCSCGCPVCCEDEDAEGALDEEVVEVGKFDAEGIAVYLDSMLYDRLDQIAEGEVEDAIHAIVEYYEGLDGKPTEDLMVEDISGGVYDILEDIGSLKNSLAEEVASDIEDYVLAHFYEVVEE
jgi:hypothetical protein